MLILPLVSDVSIWVKNYPRGTLNKIQTNNKPLVSKQWNQMLCMKTNYLLLFFIKLQLNYTLSWQYYPENVTDARYRMVFDNNYWFSTFLISRPSNIRILAISHIFSALPWTFLRFVHNFFRWNYGCILCIM